MAKFKGFQSLSTYTRLWKGKEQELSMGASLSCRTSDEHSFLMIHVCIFLMINECLPCQVQYYDDKIWLGWLILLICELVIVNQDNVLCHTQLWWGLFMFHEESSVSKIVISYKACMNFVYVYYSALDCLLMKILYVW